MRENTGQNNSKYRHFLRSDVFFINRVCIKETAVHRYFKEDLPLKMSENFQEFTWDGATYLSKVLILGLQISLKKDYIAGIFLWILLKNSEQLINEKS